MPTPTAIEAARRFRRRLDRQEQVSFARMARLYSQIIKSFEDDIKALAQDVAEEIEGAASISIRNGQLVIDGKQVRLLRLTRLIRQAQEQLARFGGGAIADEITLIQSQAIQSAINDALTLIDVSLPEDLPAELRRTISGSFTRLPADAIEAAAGLLDADSPLRFSLEQSFGETIANQIEESFLTGIAKGQNPRVIARLIDRNITGVLGRGLTWAMTTVRTAQIKSYQLANHAIYQANVNLIPTWTWHSALDNRTCLSCISKHGQEFPVTESLTDHHNGRCVPLPTPITFADLGITGIQEQRIPTISGEEWFKSQPKERQIEMMGGAMYRAWKDNEFNFGELSQTYQDPIYGELFRQASLKGILGDRAKDFYRQRR